jgi:hypothetical protein
MTGRRVYRLETTALHPSEEHHRQVDGGGRGVLDVILRESSEGRNHFQRSV